MDIQGCRNEVIKGVYHVIILPSVTYSSSIYSKIHISITKAKICNGLMKKTIYFNLNCKVNWTYSKALWDTILSGTVLETGKIYFEIK